MPEQTTSTAPRGQESGAIEYGAYYYRHDCGTPYERNEHWLGFFDKIAEAIVRDFHPASVLDAGCAMGFLVEALRKRGVEAWGVDVSEYAISRVDESVRDYCRVASLTEPLERRYDLIVSIEVVEHIPPGDADAAIANLCDATDRLLLSTSPEDYGEATHLNVQPPEAWSALLAREGFVRELERDVSYVTPWAGLYRRFDEPLSEVVRNYDRAWWRLRQEVSEVRDALLATQGQLAGREGDPLENRPELQRELDRRKEELLRLRDLLVGKDAELGSARGRLAALEDQSRRLETASEKIQSRLPGAMRLLETLLRRLNGPR